MWQNSVNTRNMKEIISLAVDELIAFANTKGGTVYFGVEDKPMIVSYQEHCKYKAFRGLQSEKNNI